MYFRVFVRRLRANNWKVFYNCNKGFEYCIKVYVYTYSGNMYEHGAVGCKFESLHQSEL